MYHAACAATNCMTPLRYARLAKRLVSAYAIWRADLSELIAAGLERESAETFCAARKLIDPSALFDRIQARGISVIAVDEPGYPAMLCEIADPPYALFYRGTFKESSEWNALGVVGARRANEYGYSATHTLVAQLARAGYAIISGLAKGIDEASHRACLNADGYTVAVLASSIEDEFIYPRSNRLLAREIIDRGGALVSEYPIGIGVERYHFPARNRIISGLSMGVIIVQASETSGSLITARHALEQNRDIFAVPGPIHHPLSVGPNGLLKQGAIPLTDACDIFTFYDQALPQAMSRAAEGETEYERQILKQVSREPKHIDDVARDTQLDMSAVASTLLVMELKGLVRNIGAMRFIRL